MQRRGAMKDFPRIDVVIFYAVGNKNTVCLLKGESLARRRGGRCGRKMACYLWGTFLQNPYGQIRSLSWGKKSHFSRKTNKQTNKKHTYAPNKRASTHETLFQANNQINTTPHKHTCGYVGLVFIILLVYQCCNKKSWARNCLGQRTMRSIMNWIWQTCARNALTGTNEAAAKTTSPPTYFND